MPGDETFELIKGGKTFQVNKENVQQYVNVRVLFKFFL